MTLHHSPGKTNCLTYTPKNINLTYNAGVYTVHSGSIITVPYGGGTALKVGDTIGSYYEVVKVVGDYIQLKLLKDYSATFGGATNMLYFLALGFNANVSDGMYWAGTTVSYCTSGSTDSRASNSDGALYFNTTNNVIYRRYSNGTTGYQYGGGTNGVWISLPIAFHYGTPTKAEQVFDWCGYIGSTTFVLPNVKGLIPNGWNSDGTYKSIGFETSGVITRTNSSWNTYGWLGEKGDAIYISKTRNYNQKDNYVYENDGSKILQTMFGYIESSNNIITSLTPYSIKTTNDSVKIKDTGAYGIYFCPGKTNCLTYTPKNVNLTLDHLNVTVVGSPTINNGIVSGLTSGNYVKTPNQLNLTTASNWEIVIKYTHLANGSLRGFCGLLTGDNVQCNFYITDSNTVQSDGVWGNLESSTSLIVGSTYWTKLQFTGSQYILSLSTNGKDFINQSVINSTAKVSLAQNFAFGCDRATSSINGTVSIDLSQSYIKINGSTWWKGGTGALILKAGSKVYNGNGLLLTKTSDSISPNANYNGQVMMFMPANGDNVILTAFNGGTVSALPPIETSYKAYYNTSDGKCYLDAGYWIEVSFPIAIGTSTTGYWVSIDQIFDWCGYIGSTAFVLPGVKGLIPDGFNADGTYKNIEYTVPSVLTATRTWNWGTTTDKSQVILLRSNNNEIWFYNVVVSSDVEPSNPANYTLWHDTKRNLMFIKEGDGTTFTRVNWLPAFWCGSQESTTIIASTTPYSVKTTNDLQAINAIYNGSQKVYQYLPTGVTFNPSSSFQTYVVPKGVTKLQVDCVAAKGNGNGYGGRVVCVLTVTPGQTLYLAVGSANTSRGTPTYNASDIRTNGNGITDTTSLQSRLVVAGGGGNTGNQTGTGGHGGGLTGAAGSDVDGKSGGGGTQTAGGAGGINGYWGKTGYAGGFGLGGAGDDYGAGGCGGAGWYGGGGGGSSAYGSTLGGNGGGGSSYTNSSLCTNVVHTQGYRNGNGYITITPVR